MLGEYCGGSAQWQLMSDDLENTLKFELPLSAWALAVEQGMKSPNLNPECPCCARSFLTKVVRYMYSGLQSLQVGDARNRGVSIWEDIMHLMNDSRQDPMDVILALVQKCRQGRDVASIHDYLGTQNRRQMSTTAPLNQVLTTQQQPTGGDGGSSRRMCYRNYLGVSCKFGNECKHVHAGPNSAARREFEQNPTEMELTIWCLARDFSGGTQGCQVASWLSKGNTTTGRSCGVCQVAKEDEEEERCWCSSQHCCQGG